MGVNYRHRVFTAFLTAAVFRVFQPFAINRSRIRWSDAPTGALKASVGIPQGTTSLLGAGLPPSRPNQRRDYWMSGEK
jgi:hypothetical protein